MGLRVINVNVTENTEESGYLEALGKEAAARAINDAKISVAEKNRDGSIGQANAQKDERISVSSANAAAINGENEAKAAIAQSDATRREREAEAARRAVAAENVAKAKALEESYIAEKQAEESRAERELATQKADVIVKAEIQKQRVEIEAEAEAEMIRRKAKGEADAIYAKMEAQARGMQEILTKQASGFAQIVAAAGGSAEDAVQLILADKMEELIKTQVEAVKDIKIDKVTVWDSGNGSNGKTSTANFISGLMQSVPPLSETFKMTGMKVPKILGSEIPEVDENNKEEDK